MGKGWNSVRRETKDKGEGEEKSERDNSEEIIEPSKTKGSRWLQSEVSPSERHPRSTSSFCMILGNVYVLF